MAKRCDLSRVFVAGALLVMLPAAPSAARQQRIRTLTFDPEKQSWMEMAAPPAGTIEGDLYLIRMSLKHGKHRAALRSIEKHIAKYGVDHSHYPAVLLAKAEGQIGRGRYYKAHQTLQQILSRFPASSQTGEALRLEYTIAETFLSGVKRRLWGLRILSARDTAFEVLDQISTDHPESRLGELSLKTKGDHLFAEGEYELAELEYARLLHDYPATQYHRFALRRVADAALAGFAGVEYDDAALIEADERFREYRTRYPLEAKREGVGLILDDLQEKRAEKAFRIGRYYERTQHLSSAVYYYRSVRLGWPDSIAAVKATRRMELLGELEALPAPVSAPPALTGEGATSEP
ncbi:MAG: hypothetical protein ACE5EX_08150 [Phycisphaerae bacterium]